MDDAWSKDRTRQYRPADNLYEGRGAAATKTITSLPLVNTERQTQWTRMYPPHPQLHV
ncbi:hypothetical protein POX_b02124 [Penicillium oxalicum]|uniref:hypothetical protein n=1 Tax=Penicillium oxalicum TaxID=69781 RepID=UPI0020B854DD|nr:hypothetical protein POX_b02124 [Penicillium oxalicum]KAI2792089.1 hypothetical protein POX_b02124 [Penicillium oxalicum]